MAQLQQLIDEFRRSGLFSDEQIQKAARMAASRFVHPVPTESELQDFFRRNELNLPQSYSERLYAAPERARSPEIAERAIAVPPARSRPNGNQEQSASPADSKQEPESETAVTKAARSVEIAAAVAGAASVIRNFIGGVKDSFDIKNIYAKIPNEMQKNVRIANVKVATHGVH